MTIKKLSLGRIQGKIYRLNGGLGSFYFYTKGADIDGVYGTAQAMSGYLEGRFDLAGACIVDRGREVAWIEQISVQPAYQGLGVGGRLLQHTLHRLFDAGAREAWLSAAPDDDALRGPLIRFYERYGFELSPEECREIADWNSSGTLDIMMAKLL